MLVLAQMEVSCSTVAISGLICVCHKVAVAVAHPSQAHCHVEDVGNSGEPRMLQYAEFFIIISYCKYTHQGKPLALENGRTACPFREPFPLPHHAGSTVAIGFGATSSSLVTVTAIVPTPLQ